jgi:hypothetical protein
VTDFRETLHFVGGFVLMVDAQIGTSNRNDMKGTRHGIARPTAAFFRNEKESSGVRVLPGS